MRDFVVWKYDVPVRDGVFTINMPFQSKILSVHCQGGDGLLNPKIWVAVDQKFAMQERRFIWVPTGNKFNHFVPDEEMEFIGTVLLLVGKMVVHLFEVKP